MIEQILQVAPVHTLDFWAYVFGVGLVLFALLWSAVVAHDAWRRRDRPSLAWAALILSTVVIGCGFFLYLTASTTARQAFINLPMREMASSLIKETLGLGLAVAAMVSLQRVARSLGKDSVIRRGVLASLGGALLIGLTSWVLYAMTFQPDIDDVAAVPPDLASLQIADNIGIKVFENKTTKKPTAMELGPRNELYVAGRDGYIWVMQDADQDGVADKVTEFAKNLDQPEGLAWGPKGLYVTVQHQVLLLTDTNGDDVADERTAILDGLPGEVYAVHQTNAVTFGPDGRLYVGVGSTTDRDPEPFRLAARILSLNPDGSDLQVYASGLRNPFKVIPAPGGGFFAIDNSASGCVGPGCQATYEVPDELNYVVRGGHYGFPDFYGVPPTNSHTMPPVLTFPEHSAPAGLVLYDGDQLPAKYRGQMFVALWNRNEIHSVRVLRIDERHFVGSSRLFLSGILGPTALVTSPNGGLYAASFTGSTVYYIGGTNRRHEVAQAPGASAPRGPVAGQQLALNHCAPCHGLSGQGVKKLGNDLTRSQFVASSSDEELVAFIKKGRDANDPLNKSGVTMPPKGGRPELTDQDLRDIVAYMRATWK